MASPDRTPRAQVAPVVLERARVVIAPDVGRLDPDGEIARRLARLGDELTELEQRARELAGRRGR